MDLLVDEWGTWFDVEPGTNPGHLFQQNTMRDAMVAALSLNIFHRYTERIKMTNIAQVANVLQSMVLTKGDKMVLTPTYHVFRMYNVHQDAVHQPLKIESDVYTAENGRSYPVVDATASRNSEGILNITLTNTSLHEAAEVEIAMDGKVRISAEVLTSDDIHDYNGFDRPEVIKPVEFKDFKVKGDKIIVRLPAMSVVSLSCQN